MFGRVNSYLRWIAGRVSYFSAKLVGFHSPAFPVASLPDGFSLRWVGATGLAIVENFVSRKEAEYIIALASNDMEDSLITVGKVQLKDSYRKSQTAAVLEQEFMDPLVVTIVRRAAMLLAIPPSHVESVYVTRYTGGEYYKAHHDAYPGFDGDRLYTTLIYLNDVAEDGGGGTTFERLNIGVQPRCGRAVIWTNKNPDGSLHPETLHEALPVAPGAVKWVIQLWFRGYPLLSIPKDYADDDVLPVAFARRDSELLIDENWGHTKTAADGSHSRPIP